MLALGLVACGGSSNKKSTPPTPMDVAMAGVHEDAEKKDGGPVTLQPGGTVTYGDVTYTCAAGGAPCELMVKDGKATYTGGTVTAATQASFAQNKEAEKAKDDAIAAAVTRADTAMKAAETAKMRATGGTTGDDAKTGTDASMEAVENLVMMQTGGMAIDYHEQAKAAADKAAAEYEKAKTAHTAAGEATTGAAAETEAGKAEAAQKAAEAAADEANEKAKMAVDAASMGLKFNAETMTYSVGSMSVMTGADDKDDSLYFTHPGADAVDSVVKDGVSGNAEKAEDLVTNGSPSIAERDLPLGESYVAGGLPGQPHIKSFSHQ